MANNGGTFGRCDLSLSGSGNASIFGEIKHGSALALFIFINQEYEGIVSHRV